MSKYLSKPRVFGFPWWDGLQKESALRRISNFSGLKGIEYKLWNYNSILGNLSIGDLVSECSGFNSRIVNLDGVYRRYRKGYILVDVDIETDRTSCSFRHCGVWKSKTKEELEAYRDGLLKAYPNDEWGFKTRFENVKFNLDGTDDRPNSGFATKGNGITYSI